MSYSITNLAADVSGALHGTTINQITNWYGLIDRAARRLISDVDPMETKRIMPIGGTIFNSVWDYPLPADLKGNKIIDIAPQVNRQSWDLWLQTFNQDFDRTKGTPWSNDMLSVLFNSGVKTLRLNAPFLNPPLLIDAANYTTGWTASGGATTPTLDTVNYAYSGGSLLFNLQAGYTTGTLTKTLSSPIDLTTHQNLATEFLYTYLPTPSAVTSVTYQFGSDANDYYQVSTSVTQQNTAFTQGWNFLAMPWPGSTVVGTPVVSNIQWISVTWTYNGTLQTGIRLNDINSNLGSILNMEYYSKYLFSSNTGVWQETVQADTDLINLDTDSYNLLFNLVMCLATQQQQGLDALFYDGNFFMQQYTNDLQTYKNKYPSEVQLAQSTYYKLRKPRRIPGWRFGY